MNKVYICIDLKTFFASCECSERGLDPFETNLVVADPTRGQGTLCLAITPKMKAMGIKNRCRMFEIPKDVEYIIATPRMSHYMEWSKKVYKIYLKYVSPEDIHVYSIDEVFMDITKYLSTSKMTPKEFASQILLDIYDSTGLTATAGIGTNLYLSKVAMDIVAKHINTDQNGLRIALLDEKRYRKYLWNHRPLTDFWRVGKGT